MRKFLLILGIIFTALSVFITHFIGEKQHDKSIKLQQEINSAEKTIDLIWQQQQELERKFSVNTILILIINDKNNNISKSAKDFILKYINKGLYDVDPLENLDNIPNIDNLYKNIEAKKQKVINSINNLYIEKLEKEAQIQNLKKKNDIIKSIAILLQIIGLVLVLYYANPVKK
ncbi:MAG: hypothetical protein HRU35_07275 [Rickettsiaceae bacterium]|nr:hypothetical protein [Rickettsiaceae bacterium]